MRLAFDRAIDIAGLAAPAAPIDPKYLAAARELRDRWMERVNANDGDAAPALAGHAKYDLPRALPAAAAAAAKARLDAAPLKRLPAAA